MGKLFKLIFWLAGIAITLAVVVVVAVTLFFDPNDFKNTITSEVKETTGRELLIDGDIKLTFFPWVGVEMGKARLSNAEGFGSDAFFRVDAAKVRVKLIPLLKKQVEMDTIVLDGLELRLSRRADGRTNWDDLLAPTGDRSGTRDKAKDEPAVPAVAALAIGGMDVRNAHIIWDDQQQGGHVEITKMLLKTGELALGDPVDLKMSFDITGRKPDITGRVDLAGSLVANPAANSYRFHDTRLKVDTRDDKGKPLTVDLSADIETDFINQTLSLAGLNLEVDSQMGTQPAKLGLKANVNGRLDTRVFTISDATIQVDSATAAGAPLKLVVSSQIEAAVAQQNYHLKRVKATADATGLDGKPVKLELQGDINADLARQTASVQQMTLEGEGLKVTGSVSVQQLKTTPLLKGQVNVAAFNPRSVLPRFGINLPETRDNQAFQQLALNLKQVEIALDPAHKDSAIRKVSILAMEARLDDSQLSGSLSVTDLAAPAIAFDLDIDSINVDRYLPPEKARPAEQPKVGSNTLQLLRPAHAAVPASTSLQHAFLQKLNLNGTLDINSMTFQDLRAQDTHAGLSADKGRIRLSPMRTSLSREAGKGMPFSMNMQGNINADLERQTAEVQGMTLQGEGLKVTGSMSAQQLMTTPQLRGEMNVAAFNPRSVLPRFGISLPATRDARALQFVALNLRQMEIAVDPSYKGSAIRKVSIPSMEARLDDSHLRGSLSVTDLAAPAIVFDLDVDSINMDRYLPPKKSVPADAPKQQSGGFRFGFFPAAHAAAAPAAAGQEYAFLRDLKMNGTLDIKSLIFNNLKAQDTHATVNADKGLIKLNPIRTAMYRGRYNGAASVDARDPNRPPLLSINNTIEDLDLQSFLVALAGNDSLSGRANRVSANLTAHGLTADEITRTLEGTVDILVTNGVVKGFNIKKAISEEIVEARNVIKGTPLSVTEYRSMPDETRFTEMKGRLEAREGVFRCDNRKLVLLSPDFTVRSKCKIDLPRERLKIDGDVRLAEDFQMRGLHKAELKALKKNDIPIKAECPLNNISAACVDKTGTIASIMGNVAKDAIVDQGIEKLLGGDKKAAPKGGRKADPLKDLLKGILGR